MSENQEVDLKELALKYGNEFAAEIEKQINICKELNHDFIIRITQETKNFLTFTLATNSYVNIYEVSKNQFYILRHSFVSYNDCEKALELMRAFD
ncbi:hypothetical protein [Bacillus sp. B-jedd]|uniref:hypothetical protein n=1 Tax=Bacillus sp. B-jedd TaxID=1476857 RepID=UPI0005156C43|nr:hypothetical protein [Bacillus sp. B-jedd]CEG25970.1 hypothetical protein BN1002_00808 [Bacillus sp. B-jedd]